MSDEGAMRSAINQAHESYKNSNVLTGEIALFSVVLALQFKSWWVFGGVFFGFFIAMRIPYLGSALLFLLSLLWGAFGWGIGGMFNNLGAKVVLGLIGLFAGLNVHFSGWQWFKDRK